MFLNTGIPKLNELLNGGIKKNSLVLINAQPGVRCMEFLQQVMFQRLTEGGKGIYIVNNKSADAVKKMFSDNDWDISGYEKQKKACILDAYNSYLTNAGTEKDKDFSGILSEQMISKLKDANNGNILLVFDALSSFIDISGEDAVSFFEKNAENFMKYNVTVLALFVEWPYENKLIARIRSIFDCIIDLKAVEKKVILRNYFAVSKAEWVGEIKQKEVPFKIMVPGGVKVYIPKVLVTGPYHAGKSSFVHSASIRAVSVNRVGTTIALDYGNVMYNGLLADLFGTPGQERFDPILNLLAGEALGVVIVIDSTDPSSFARAKEMMEKTKTKNLPYVIAANKSDLKGALGPEQIREKMNLPKDTQIIPVAAEDLNSIQAGEPCKLKKEDVNKVLGKLFEVVV
jgi:hypothetical protein